MRSTLVLALLVAGCANKRLPAAEQAAFEPITFFAGQSHGSGSLKVLLSRTVPIAVESAGTREADGLLLRQTIREGDKPPRTREWRMRRVAPGRYSGTLTEAEGPVSLITHGPRALIRYRMNNGLAVRQELALQADERTLLNRMEVSKWGVPVARLNETIRKAD